MSKKNLIIFFNLNWSQLEQGEDGKDFNFYFDS